MRPHAAEQRVGGGVGDHEVGGGPGPDLVARVAHEGLGVDPRVRERHAGEADDVGVLARRVDRVDVAPFGDPQAHHAVGEVGHGEASSEERAIIGTTQASPHHEPSYEAVRRLMALIHNVVGPPTATRVLLLVHGYGADERDLGGAAAVPRSRGHFLTVLPRGPGGRPARVLPGTTSAACSAGHSTDAHVPRVARGARRPARRRVRGARTRIAATRSSAGSPRAVRWRVALGLRRQRARAPGRPSSR